mgnify:CR=1 FL=1
MRARRSASVLPVLKWKAKARQSGSGTGSRVTADQNRSSAGTRNAISGSFTFSRRITTPTVSVAEAISRVNRELARDNERAMFVTAIAARLDLATHSFRSWEIPIEPRGSETPYALHVRRSDDSVWICGTNSDSLIRFDPASERFTVYPLPSRVTYTRELDFDEHARRSMLERLKRSDQDAELSTRLEIVERHLERRLHAAEHLRAQCDSRAIDDGGEHLDAGPFGADQRRRGHLAVSQSNHGDVTQVNPLLPPCLEPRRPAWNEK